MHNKKKFTTQLFLLKQITQKEFLQHNCLSLNKLHKKSFQNTVFSLQRNDNAKIHFQQRIINDASDNISKSKFFTFTIFRTLIIEASAVYRVALIQSRGSSLVFTHCMADILVMSDIPVTLGLVPVELSTIISSSHVAT